MRKLVFIVTHSLAHPEQPKYRDPQHLREDRKLVVRHKAGADLDAADAVPLDNNAPYLHPGCQIRLLQPLLLSRFSDTIAGNILFAIIVIYFHIVSGMPYVPKVC